MSIFKKQPPPPPPIYKRQPMASIAVILTMVTMFVLGPVGYLWNGMAAENKENRGAIVQNQLAIKEILTRQEMIIKSPSRGGNIIGPATIKNILTPEEFEKYLSFSKEDRLKYKQYLKSTGKDVSSLPD